MADKRVCIIGCGINGLVTGSVFARLGHRVRLVDKDETILSNIARGEMPSHEPGLSSLLLGGIRTRRIYLSPDIEESVGLSDYVFLAVRMTGRKSHNPNFKYLKEAASELAGCALDGKTLVLRETSKPGATEEVLGHTIEKTSGQKPARDFALAANPAFFSRGRAVEDALAPDLIIVGSNSRKGAADVMSLYDGIKAPKMITDIRTAETIKLVRSCLQAADISVANEIADLCESIGVDAVEVMEAATAGYSRIVKPGLGFGGARLPRDLAAVASAQESFGLKGEMLKSVGKVNARRSKRVIEFLIEELGDLRGKRIVLLGLSYKAGLDDVTNSVAFPTAVELLARGAKVIGYDPLAKSSFIKILPGISYASSLQEALLEADACIIQTEEEEFSKINKRDLELMNNKLIVDGRRVTSPAKLIRLGASYRAIGLGREKNE